MQIAMIIQTESDIIELNEHLKEGWTVKTTCPLVPSASVGDVCTSYIERGRALVVLER